LVEEVRAMHTVDELLEQAKQLPPRARRELLDKLDQWLSLQKPPEELEEGPYASLLELAGTAHSKSSDVARNKNENLADIYASKRTGK
jgi:hypothetical protein